MSPCEQLLNESDVLRKNSIYIRKEGEDKDFEFFILIDPDSQDKRGEFLQELYQILLKNGEEDSKEFALDKHRVELERWMGKKKSDFVTPLNWIKIAIEQYPYRFFIAIDAEKAEAEEGGWKNHNGFTPSDDEFWYRKKSSRSGESKKSGKSENSFDSNREWLHSKFLYKRICWLNKNDLCRILLEYDKIQGSDAYAFREVKAQTGEDLAKEGYLKLWLYLTWIVHICRRIRRIKSQYLLVHFYKLGTVSEEATENPPYFTNTLPAKLREKKPERYTEFLSIDLDNTILDISTQSSHDFAYPTLLFRRHANAFRLYGEEWQPEYSGSDSFYYGESMSGALSYWTVFIDSVTNIGQERCVHFALSLIEQALMRIFLIDERVQEWFDNLDREMAGYIIQQRLFISFLDNTLKYNQKGEPHHNLYGILKTDENKDFDLEFSNEDFFRLISGKQSIHNYLDGLIIHQGILDKWSSGSSELLEVLLKWKDSVPYIVITSGRGVPSNLPCGVKFLPFSGLESCITDSYFEKLTLIRQFFSLKIEDVR